MLEHIDYNHVYCLFCKTGSEEQVAAEIEKQQKVRALVALQEKHKKLSKKYEIDRRIFLPGYLFLYTNEEIRFDIIQKISNVYRILGDRNEICELSGYDRSFAEWLYLNDGIVGISRIRVSNGNLSVSSGPMRYFLNKIIRIDKHTKNALARIHLYDRVIDLWLAFDFDDTT